MYVDVKKYLPTNESLVLVSQARQVGAAKALLEATEIKREELRKVNEETPKESPNDLTEDYRYIAGFIACLNWITRLPERSMEFRENKEKRR